MTSTPAAGRLAVTVLHNPSCSTSQHAVDTLTAAGVRATVRRYLDDPLDEAGLRGAVAVLEDPVTDLVRRGPAFERAGLSPEDVADADGVVSTLLAHPELMQRPVVIAGGRALIGRPRGRVGDLVERVLRDGPGGAATEAE